MNIKNLILLFAALIAFSEAKSQTTPGPEERKFTDTICNLMSHIDFSKVTTKEQATAIFTECFTKNPDMIVAVAEERGADMTDHAAMREIGIDIGKNLLRMKCANFLKLSSLMASKEVAAAENAIQGKLVRMETKGFNYIVIVDDAKKEHSFLWLHQFPGSDKFVNGLGVNVGKKVSITWQDNEVFLPAAKGYYNVKEITALSIF